MTLEDQRLLVLRLPQDQGNYTFQLAELPAEEAERVEQLLRTGDWPVVESQVRDMFGEPFDLGEAMRRLHKRDYTVLAPSAAVGETIQ